MTSKTKEHKPNPVEVSGEEMNELRRDMRTVHLTAWARENQQKIIAAVVGLLILIVGISLWKNHIATQRASAAALYHQAMNTAETQAKRSLLEKVVKDYKETAYGGLARLLLSRVDSDHAVRHLTALVSRSGLDQELGWQARLDLAQAYLSRHDKARARETLSSPVGGDYEQLRHYLLARASTSDTDRIMHLQKALAAVSHDAVLKRRIKQRLAGLNASPSGHMADSAGDSSTK